MGVAGWRLLIARPPAGTESCAVSSVDSERRRFEMDRAEKERKEKRTQERNGKRGHNCLLFSEVGAWRFIGLADAITRQVR